MKIFFILLTMITSVFAQENFGIKERVNNFTEKNVRQIVIEEFAHRIGKFRKLQTSPAAYYDSLGLTKSEKKSLFKPFEHVLKKDLPKLTIKKSGALILTNGNHSAHFTVDDLIERKIYIDNKLVKLPPRSTESATEYFSIFMENYSKVFKKKVTLIDLFKSFSIIDSAHAESAYLNIPDEEELPDYYMEGYDKNIPVVENLYKEEEEKMLEMYGTRVRHNINHTAQVLVLGVLALASDLDFNQWANFDNKKVELPRNLKLLFDRIAEYANTCDEERIATNGKYRDGSRATEMLTALDVTLEKLNRLDAITKRWWRFSDDFLWNNTSFHLTGDAKSYNICRTKRITDMYYDKNLCDNMDKLTQCLIDFRSSGRVSQNRLTDDQVELLINHIHTGKRMHGEADVLKWIQEK